MVKHTFKNLDKNDIILGPCEDGGYYLIALREVYKGLFENISWSSNNVFHQSLAQAKSLNLEFSVLQEKYDIDIKADLQKLYTDLKHRKNRKDNFPTHSWMFLKNFFTEK